MQIKTILMASIRHDRAKERGKKEKKTRGKKAVRFTTGERVLSLPLPLSMPGRCGMS